MKRPAIILIVIVLALYAYTCHAAAEARKATDFVQAMLTEIIAIQNDPRLQNPESKNMRKDLVRKIILRSFDFNTMAKDALGPQQWNGMTKSQQTEFKSVFQDLFVESYLRLVLDFLKKEKIEYGEERHSQGKRLVKTIMHRQEDRIPVDYFLIISGDRWTITDVTIEGVSIIENYRKSFSRIIRQDSLNGLLRKMRLQQKAAQGNGT
ncbi:MAG TPA: ABC transporter substrate-binding protein [Syntrophorhabdaceae bacterium]|jgi:phospholipid transport system substrate-binding protein